MRQANTQVHLGNKNKERQGTINPDDSESERDKKKPSMIIVFEHARNMYELRL